jgi:hypothetical protein
MWKYSFFSNRALHFRPLLALLALSFVGATFLPEYSCVADEQGFTELCATQSVTEANRHPHCLVVSNSADKTARLGSKPVLSMSSLSPLAFAALPHSLYQGPPMQRKWQYLPALALAHFKSTILII